MTPLARGTKTSKRGTSSGVDDLTGDVLGLDRLDPALADPARSARCLRRSASRSAASTPLPEALGAHRPRSIPPRHAWSPE